MDGSGDPAGTRAAGASRAATLETHVRRTKDESQQTRRDILDAARAVFARHGVSRTTLEHIAREAGVTRGAIYWHFANKSALFQAMREQVALPLVDRTDFALLQRESEDPLACIQRFIESLVDLALHDAPTRATLEILTLKCEYVDEFADERTRQARQCVQLQKKLAARYEAARAAGTLREDLSPEVAALDTSVFVMGLLRMALLARDRALDEAQVRVLIEGHVASRRPPTPARARTPSRVGPRASVRKR